MLATNLLKQHVTFSTHAKSHYLDLMITKEIENCFAVPYSSEPGLSDHLAIFIKFYVQKPGSSKKLIQLTKSKRH
jgi:hypothetical protein